MGIFIICFNNHTEQIMKMPMFYLKALSDVNLRKPIAYPDMVYS